MVTPVWVLRITLGLMYLYSGFDLILHPTAWVWGLPYWLRQVIGSVVAVPTYLKFQGAVELVMGLILLAWFVGPRLVKWVAALSALEMAAILLLTFIPFSATNLLITFRDIGVLGASLALFVVLSQTSRIYTNIATNFTNKN